MPKIYAGIGLILLLGVAAAIWWHNGTVEDAYKAGKTAGQDSEKVKWQTLLLDSQAKAETEKQRLENILKLERKSWETRINDLKKMRTDCANPDILRLLNDSGVYSGLIPCN